MIPDEVIDEVRERTDIVSVVGEHVQLKKVGASHKGLCPFHQEKTPSFHVNPARRTFYCFGCQKKGDVFGFLMELQGKSFAEVVRELASRSGVLIPETAPSPEEAARRSERGRLYDLHQSACAFYQAVLGDGRGAGGRAYLQSRGVGDEVAATFRLGQAPDAWDGLTRHLEAHRASAADAVLLGLVAPRNGGRGYYDKFRNRLMCPVILPGGEIAGFSGRTIGGDPETPKYVNSPESPLYKKSKLLFGLHAARAGFARKGRAVLVEGNFDVVSLHQAGFNETVAPLGTALTAEQVEVLRRLVSVVVLCLDGDKAGRAAALRDIPLLVGAVEARIARLPDGEDPDSFVRKYGAAALEEILAKATPAFEYFVHELWSSTNQSTDQLAAALAAYLPLISAISDDNKRHLAVHYVAKTLRVDADVVRRGLRGGTGAAPVGRITSQVNPLPTSELKIIAILDAHPDLFDEAESMGIGSLLTDARLRDMYLGRRKGMSFLDEAPPDIRHTVAEALHAGHSIGVTNPRRTLHDMWRNLQLSKLDAEADQIDREQKEAERRGDAALARELGLKGLQTRKKADALKQRPEDEPR